jgi:hypothetical protein
MNYEQYFRECDLQERMWRVRVGLNKKTTEVNRKLVTWHNQNPDRAVVNLAQWRIDRVRRTAMARIGATA